MIINFRQGIISGQANFITFANNVVSINVDQEYLDLAFAFGATDYLFSEVEDVTGAWGPFAVNSSNYYLYWDINVKTAVRTYGYTTIAPSYGSSLPTTNLQINQHFFNTSTKMMMVWNGVSWDQRLRVFAGVLQSNGILVPNSTGSQVGLFGNYSIGYILYDVNNNPLLRTSGSTNNYFVTTEDKVHTQYDVMNAYKIAGLLMNGIASEPIPAYYCVTWKGPLQLGVASYINYTYPCVGISTDATGLNQLTQFVTKGFITNYGNWNWTEAPNTPLFVGATGELTTTVPNQYSLQKVGHIVSPDTIFVDLQELILIEDTYVTPTPSVTMTSTPIPSPTPSLSLSVTPTPSVTNTPSVTPTLSITVSTSITPSVTASATPSPTPTVTPTVTPTPSPAGAVLLSQSGQADLGVSGENTITITFCSGGLCSIPPSPIPSSAVTSITSFVCNYTQYADNSSNNEDSNCQLVAPTTEGSILASGTFNSDDYIMEQHSSSEWYYQSLPPDLLNLLEEGNVVVESILQTNVGQIISYLVINAF
jgi:hypothetical protein